MRRQQNGVARLKAYTGRRGDLVELVPAGVHRVLDVGCSSGQLAEELKERWDGIDYVVGIEIDRQLVGSAEALDKILVEDAISGMARLVDEGESFDLVVFGDTLEHLVDPWTALDLAGALLKEHRGWLLVSLPNVGFWTTYVSLLRGRWPYKERGVHDRTHLRWFGARDVVAMATRQDFALVQLVRKYRLLDISHPVNRWAKIPGRLAPNLLTYQFVFLSRSRGSDG